MYLSVRTRPSVVRRVLPKLMLMFAVFAPAWAQSLKLQWDPSPSPDVKGYNLYRSKASGRGYTRVNSSAVSATSFTDSTLQYDTTYYYVCTAVNQAGLESGYSNEIQAAITPYKEPANNPPVARNDFVTLGSYTPYGIDVLANDTDADGDTLTVVSVNSPAHGTAQISNGSFVTYTPSSGLVGSDGFRYMISDSHGGTSTATVSISIVQSPNDPPTAKSDTVVTDTGTAVNVAVLLNDSDPNGDELSILKVTQPVHGTVTILDDTRLSYRPDAGFSSCDSFQYWATDGRASASAEVTVKVMNEGAGDPFYFPASIGDGAPPFDNLFVGIAVLNDHSRFASLKLRAFKAAGQEVTSALLVDDLAPYGQKALLARALNDPNHEAAYITARSPGQNLTGMMVVGDLSSRRLDGIAAAPAAGRVLYIPEVMMSQSKETFVQLINEESRSGSIVLDLYDGQGHPPVRWSGRIAAAGSISGLASDFFGYHAGLDGFIKVTSQVNVRGLAVSAGQEWLSTVPTMIARTSSTWMSPHVIADGAGVDTLIRVVNMGSAGAFGTVKIFNDAGKTLASQRVFLPPRQLTVVAASDLFSGLLSSHGAVSGSMVLTLDAARPQVVLATYITPDARTTVPLLTEGENSVRFADIAHFGEQAIRTGLAIFNPSSSTVKVMVQVFDAAGECVATTVFNLGPKARQVKMLGDPKLLGPGFEQIEGHIRVQSNPPVVTYMTLGDDHGQTLSAVEAQAP